MNRKKYLLGTITVVLLAVSAIMGVLSCNINYGHEVTNMYGESVKLFGYGIYSYDTYSMAPIFIGTDICMLLLVIPMFIWSMIKCGKEYSKISELKLMSVYGVVVYYAIGMTMGVSFNSLFLIYTALLAASLCGMFMHMRELEWGRIYKAPKSLYVFLTILAVALIAAWMPDIIKSILHGGRLEGIGVYTTMTTYVLDMAIVCPLCFVCMYHLRKRNSLGPVILALILKAVIVVGFMMIPQTICLMLAGIEISTAALILKTAIFVVLGGLGLYFDLKFYKRLKQ